MSNGLTSGVIKAARRGLHAALAVLVLASHAAAVTPVSKTFSELVSEADLIAVGAVQGTSSSQLPQGIIVTDVTLAILRNLKGPASEGSTVALRMLGGKVGDRELRIPGAPVFQTGQTVVVFVRGNGVEMFPFVGVQQGVFSVRTGADGRAYVFDAAGSPVTGVGEHVDVDASRQTPPITLDDFIQAVQTRTGT